jgi:hypothetical protein
MITTSTEAYTQLQLLLTPVWSFNQLEIYYGINLSAAPQSFLAQYRFWAESYRDDDPSAVIVSGEMNRFYLELFLQHRALLGIRAAATQLGMDVPSLQATLDAAKTKDLITVNEANGEFPAAHVYQSSFISNLYRRFSALSKFTFTSYSSYCKRLHDTIEKDLGIKVTPALCVTSRKLNETPIEFGHDLDSITDEPVGLGFHVWLKTKKPIQLKPDCCSWLTFVRFEAVLKDYANLDNDTEFQKHRHALTN